MASDCLSAVPTDPSERKGRILIIEKKTKSENNLKHQQRNSYSKDDIERKIEELGEEQAWNHDIELPYGLKTIGKRQLSHGKNLVKWARIEDYIRTIGLENKRVLDVGCNEGFFSLKMSEAGAKEISAFDISEFRIKKAEFVFDALGVDNIQLEEMGVYDDRLKTLGHFDLALCMGFLHRVPDPYTVIETLTEISDMILFEWKCLKEDNYHLPIMRYQGDRSLENDIYSTAYFIPSINCVIEMLKGQGFNYNFIVDDSEWRRAIVISSRIDNEIFKHKHIVSNKGRIGLLYKYTRRYVSNVLGILKGRIHV